MNDIFIILIISVFIIPIAINLWFREKNKLWRIERDLDREERAWLREWQRSECEKLLREK